jgi:hypothetical protein
MRQNKERGGAHGVEEELVAVLAGDGNQPVARVPALHDAHAGLAMLRRPVHDSQQLSHTPQQTLNPRSNQRQ